MPHMRPGECADIDHNKLLRKPVSEGHAAKWFMEPIAVSLNYLETSYTADGFPHYRDYSMTGLSGGGWTTTLYAAIDPRIKTSIPVAGSVPMYLRWGSSLGDGEQTLPELYALAGYPDLYVLGTAGSDRRQVQVLNRRDRCCFGESAGMYDATANGPWDLAMRGIEKQVDAKLASMAGIGGSFRLEIDEAADHHSVSWNTVVGTVLAELNGGLRRVGAESTESVYIREGGTIWVSDAAGWTNTALPIAGTPSVVSSVRGPELFYRSPRNQLMHAHREAGAWKEEPLGQTLTSDPVATSAVDGVVTVAGISGSYQPILLSVPLDGRLATAQLVAGFPRVIGPPSLVRDGTTVEVYARGVDSVLHLFEAPSQTMAFSHVSVGGTLMDFPTALQTNDGRMRAYVNDVAARRLREVSRDASGTWKWVDLGAVGDPTPAATTPDPAMPNGTPTAAVDGTTVRIHSRIRSGVMQTLQYDSGDWSASGVHLRMTSSPLAVRDHVFGTAVGRAVWRYDGSVVTVLGVPQ
jgi:hypothetical protein